jgi:thiamine pyrophosphokinase
MRKAVIYTGGRAPQLEICRDEITSCDLIIAADSGLDTAIRHHLVPSYLIGDSDSHTQAIPAGVEVIAHPQDKDETDTELAVELALASGCSQIILIGGGEGRMDHLISLWSLLHRTGQIIRWYTAHECVYRLTDTLDFSGVSSEAYISTVGLDAAPSIVSSRGLKWELTDFSVTLERQSISNRAVNETVHVELVSGSPVCVIVSYSGASPYLPSISR